MKAGGEISATFRNGKHHQKNLLRRRGRAGPALRARLRKNAPMPALQTAFVALSLSAVALAVPLRPADFAPVIVTSNKTLVCPYFDFVSEEAGREYEESGTGQCAGSCYGRCSNHVTKEVCTQIFVAPSRAQLAPSGRTSCNRTTDSRRHSTRFSHAPSHRSPARLASRRPSTSPTCQKYLPRVQRSLSRLRTSSSNRPLILSFSTPKREATRLLTPSTLLKPPTAPPQVAPKRAQTWRARARTRQAQCHSLSLAKWCTACLAQRIWWRKRAKLPRRLPLTALTSNGTAIRR